MKQTLFERSARAPLIVAGSGRHGEGARRLERIVEFLDLYPTLAELAGVRAPAGLHGRSLAPLLKNPDAEVGPPGDHAGPARRRRGSRTWATASAPRSGDTRNGTTASGARSCTTKSAIRASCSNLAADPKHQKVVAEMQRLLDA